MAYFLKKYGEGSKRPKEETTVDNNMEDEELMEEGNSSSSFEDIPTVQSSLMENPNITITDEGTGDVTRESWNSLKFTLDKENFA